MLAPLSQPFRAGSTSGGEEETENFGGSRTQAGGQANWAPHPALHRLAGDPEKVTQPR